MAIKANRTRLLKKSRVVKSRVVKSLIRASKREMQKNQISKTATRKTAKRTVKKRVTKQTILKKIALTKMMRSMRIRMKTTRDKILKQRTKLRPEGLRQKSTKTLRNKENNSDNSEQNSGDKKSKNKDRNENHNQQSKPQPSRLPSIEFNPSMAAFATILKWIFYITAAIAGLWFAWKYREIIAAAWREFVRDIKEFFARLFGGKEHQQINESFVAHSQTERFPRFADYSDPFKTNAYQQMQKEELIRYTFAAFEAWGRDQNLAREHDQTPHEFAQAIAQRASRMARSAHKVADFYCEAVYSDRDVSDDVLPELKKFWKKMRHLQLDSIPRPSIRLRAKTVAMSVVEN